MIGRTALPAQAANSPLVVGLLEPKYRAQYILRTRPTPPHIPADTFCAFYDRLPPPQRVSSADHACMNAARKGVSARHVVRHLQPMNVRPVFFPLDVSSGKACATKALGTGGQHPDEGLALAGASRCTARYCHSFFVRPRHSGAACSTRRGMSIVTGARPRHAENALELPSSSSS